MIGVRQSSAGAAGRQRRSVDRLARRLAEWLPGDFGPLVEVVAII